jgi:transposase
VPADREPPPGEVLAALVVSLRAELAEVRAELARALERVAELEARHEPGCCCRCGAGLAGRPVTRVERRQVFDLPPLRAEVTEHQLIERECGCGAAHQGRRPAGR